jgi:hypothetical protein
VPPKLWREDPHSVGWPRAFELGSDFEDPITNKNFEVGLAGVMALIIHFAAMTLWVSSGLISPSPPFTRLVKQPAQATQVQERYAVPDQRKFLTAALTPKVL